ncbi:hypothetical protein NMG60_11012131 [Bertholletia excelsa]
MRARLNVVVQLGFLFRASESFVPLAFDSSPSKVPIVNLSRYWTSSAFVAAEPPLCDTQNENSTTEVGDNPKDSTDVLRRWGCSDSEISKIFQRRPSLRNADIAILQPKLDLLRGLGITCSDLVKIINCRPRLLSCRLNHHLEERLDYLQAFFGSTEVLLKAIVRNPSFLTYDFHNKIKSVIARYDELGVSRQDLIQMLLVRPTLIPRTSLCNEKLDYINGTGVSKHSKMYKHVVAIIAISRIETIREKLANLEKFGFSEDDVLGLCGRYPLILSLSIEKVQRNMTFVLGTMKLPARVVFNYSFLLFSNLESVLKPRFLLAGKIEDMGLDPQIKGPALLRALRMQEKRFVRAFINCHQDDVASELMQFYRSAKCVKRLAESSRKNKHKGFPF